MRAERRGSICAEHTTNAVEIKAFFGASGAGKKVRDALRHPFYAGGRERIERARIQLRTQPRQLTLGQLTRGEHCAVAEFVRAECAVQILPGLSITDGAQRR